MSNTYVSAVRSHSGVRSVLVGGGCYNVITVGGVASTHPHTSSSKKQLGDSYGSPRIGVLDRKKTKNTAGVGRTVTQSGPPLNFRTRKLIIPQLAAAYNA